MTEIVKDHYNAIGTYYARKKGLIEDKSINEPNKQIFLKWLETKEDFLKNKRGREHDEQIRWTKTLKKYIYLFYNFNKWFNKPFNELTEQDLIKVREDLEEGRILNNKGKQYSKNTRIDYYNKVFKSSFFESLGLKDKARKIFTLEKGNDVEVRFFTKQDLDSMAKYAHSTQNKIFLYFLFDTGCRIGTTLNIKKTDCELRHNTKTNQDYYLIHVKKEYTKSKSDAAIPLLLTETNELLTSYLKEQKDNDSIFLFDFSNNNGNKIIKRISEKAGILTKPNSQKLNHHDFRRSCATHLLSLGYSLDVVKKRLQHKPSSDAIDKYVNYLGLNDEKQVTEMQESNFYDLLRKYKDTEEKLKVLDANLKNMQEKYDAVFKELERITPFLNKVLEHYEKSNTAV